MEFGAGFALLTTMVTSFEQQGIRTVFEGIEEGWQLELAEKSGSLDGAGFRAGRPELAPTSFRVFGKDAQRLSPRLPTRHKPVPVTTLRLRRGRRRCSGAGPAP